MVMVVTEIQDPDRARGEGVLRGVEVEGGVMGVVLVALEGPGFEAIVAA